MHLVFFFFNDTATTEIYTLSLHDALPILRIQHLQAAGAGAAVRAATDREQAVGLEPRDRRDRDGGGEGADQISSVHGGHEESAKRREAARRRGGGGKPPGRLFVFAPPA